MPPSIPYARLVARHGPFPVEMMGPEDEEAMMLLHHFARDIERFILKPKRLRKPEQADEKTE